jgi:hypothetical protein
LSPIALVGAFIKPLKFQQPIQETTVMEKASEIRSEYIGVKVTPLEKAAIVYGQNVAGVSTISAYLRKSGLAIAKQCADEMISRNDESLAG